ncbi:MAG: membrane dipeptidase [Rhodobacteraceae bacterium]|nr:membrane dipeptidase [Paracoccaceae bacterium]
MQKLKIAFLVLLNLALAGGLGFFAFAPGIVEKGQNRVIAHAPWPVSDAARALHATLVVGDWHADPLMWNRNLLDRGSRGQVDFPRLIEGNVALQMFTTVTKSPSGLNYDSNSADASDNITILSMAQLWPQRTWDSRIERALYQSQKLHEMQAAQPETLRIIRSRADLEALLEARASGSKQVGALLGAEGGHALDGSRANLDRLFDAGFRMVGLQHFFDNRLGGSLHGQSEAGLTPFGRAIVKDLEARQMIVDVAHSSLQVVREVLAMTERPLVVSHTGIHSHCQAKRNIPDDLMQQIAARGGLIAIGYWEEVTCDTSPAGVAGAIIAAVALVGVDHVSLGSDFDGAVETAFDTSELAALTHELQVQGMADADIAAVMGGNMVRFLREMLPQ